MRRAITAITAAILVTGFLSNAGAEPTVQKVSASRIFGTKVLDLTRCQPAPDNRAEWTRFSRCTAANLLKVQRWGHRLDACLNVYRFVTRQDDAYQTNDPDTTQSGSGLAPALPTDPAQLMVIWKQTFACQ